MSLGKTKMGFCLKCCELGGLSRTWQQPWFTTTPTCFDPSISKRFLTKIIDRMWLNCRWHPWLLGCAEQGIPFLDIIMLERKLILIQISCRDQHGRRVYLLDFEKWNPDQFSYCDLLNTCIMCMEMNALEERTQVCGAVLICSGANFGFKQFRNVGFQDLKNGALMLQVCSGHTSTRFLLRMSGCHRWLIGSW